MNRVFNLRAGASCVAVGAIALPPLALYAPLGITTLLILGAVGVAVFDGKRCRSGLAGLGGLVALFAALDLWALLSAWWSILPQHSLAQGLRFLGITVAGLTLLGAARTMTSTERRWIGQSLLVGLAIAILLLAIERFAGAPIMRLWHPLPPAALSDRILLYFRFDRGVTVLVLILWAGLFVPVFIWLRPVLLVAAAAITVLMISETSLLALGTGLVVFATARLFPRAIAVLMLGGLLAIGLAVPLATPSYQNVAALHAEMPQLKWSGIHRLLIWRFASNRIAERPLLGWGMDPSRAIPGGDTDLVPLLPPGNYPTNTQAKALPLHPHNGTLQLLLELGIPGLLLGSAIIGWVVVRVAWYAPLTPAPRAGALALIASCLTVGLLSFGIWQEWWQSTVWLAASLFAASATSAGPLAVTRAAVAAPVSPAV